MKRLLSLVVAVLLLLSFTFSAMAQEEVTIRAINWHSEREPAYELIAQKIKELYPNINFEIDNISGDYYTVLTTAIQSGDAPDLFTSHGSKNSQLGEYVKSGVCENLNGAFPTEGYPEIMVERAKVGEDFYMNPGVFYDTFPVYYNKTIFAQYGLEEPKTYDDFIAICDTLLKNNVVPIAYSAKDRYQVEFFFSTLSAALIPDWCREFNAGTAKIDDPRFRSLMDTMYEYGQKGYYGPDYLSIDGNGATLMFTSGKAAMRNSGSWDVGAFIGDKGDEFGSFYVPSKDGKVIISAGQDTCGGYSIYAQSPHKEEALKVLQYLASDEAMQILADLNLNVIAYDKLVASDPSIIKLSTYDEAIPLWIDYMFQFAVEGLSPTDRMAESMQSMYYENVTSADAVKAIEETLDYSAR